MISRISVAFYILLLVSLNSFTTKGQTAFFNFPNNGNYEIRIDSNEVFTTNKFKLDYGKHLVEIWSPGIEIIKDTVLVRKDFLPRFDYSVKVDTSFLNEKQDLKYFKSKRFLSKVFPVFLSVGFGVGSFFQYGRAKDQYEELLDFSNQYEFSSSSDLLKTYAISFEKKKSLYNKSRVLFYSLLTASAASAVVSIFTYRLFNKNNVKPNLKKYYSSPFTGKEYSLNLDVSFNSFSLICTL